MFLGTRVLCLFSSINTRSFYFSEYELLTAELENPKYWNRSWLAPFLGRDSTRNHPPKMPNSRRPVASGLRRVGRGCRTARFRPSALGRPTLPVEIFLYFCFLASTSQTAPLFEEQNE